MVYKPIIELDDGRILVLSNSDSVKAEWNGSNRSKKGNCQSEKKNKNCLLRDLSGNMTILYVHGGGFKSRR